MPGFPLLIGILLLYVGFQMLKLALILSAILAVINIIMFVCRVGSAVVHWLERREQAQAQAAIDVGLELLPPPVSRVRCLGPRMRLRYIK